jgi:hypothetical protein
MTKHDLKQLIKQVLAETTIAGQKPTPEEALYPTNVIAKQLADAMSGNPIYKNVKLSYFTSANDGGSPSVSAQFANSGDLPRDGQPYVFIGVLAPNDLYASIQDFSGKRANRQFTNVSDAVKFSKNPLSVFKGSGTSPLKGGIITKVIDFGGGSMELHITTQNGQKTKLKVTGRTDAY